MPTTFFGFFWKGFAALPSWRPRAPKQEDNPDMATLEAHDERARRFLQTAPDIETLEARMKSMEAQRPWW